MLIKNRRNMINTNYTSEFLNSLYGTFVSIPQQTAIIEGNTKISYGELESRIAAVQREIMQYKINPGQCIAVSLKRGTGLVACCLAIMLSGYVYVPMDPTYPVDRRKMIMQDCECSLLLADSVDENEYISDIPILIYSDILANASDKLMRLSTKNSIAYIIYTSGTNGSPKGVVMEYQAILNTLYWMRETFSVDSKDVVALKTAIGFTDSIIELLLPIMCGASIKVIADEDIHSMERLSIALDKVTIAQFVPPLLKMLLAYIKTLGSSQSLVDLRWILNGGQAIYMDLVNEVSKVIPHVAVANTYGMTESAVYATCKFLNPNDKEALIGKAIPNMQAYLINGDEVVSDPDTLGEICLSGIGLMTCYLNDRRLTEQKLSLHPLVGKVLYHTGDLGKWTRDGELAYCGRRDDQVNVKGKRVELNEVAVAISKIIPEAIISIVATNQDDETRILCFYSGIKIDTKYVRRELSLTLPEYMIPSKFIFINKMPITANGKVDKKELLRFYLSQNPKRNIAQIIENVWNTLLPDAENTEEDFFEAGGDSLLAIKLISMLEILGYKVDYDEFKQNPTKECLLSAATRDEIRYADTRCETL